MPIIMHAVMPIIGLLLLCLQAGGLRACAPGSRGAPLIARFVKLLGAPEGPQGSAAIHLQRPSARHLAQLQAASEMDWHNDRHNHTQSYKNHAEIIQKPNRNHTRIIQNHTKIIHKSCKTIQQSYNDWHDNKHNDRSPTIGIAMGIIIHDHTQSYKSHTQIIQKSYANHTNHIEIIQTSYNTLNNHIRGIIIGIVTCIIISIIMSIMSYYEHICLLL